LKQFYVKVITDKKGLHSSLIHDPADLLRNNGIDGS
jgi:hypothetical protein